MKKKNLSIELIKFIVAFCIGWILFLLIFAIFIPESEEISRSQGILSALFSILLAALLTTISNYNSIFRLREIAKARFSNIEIEKKRSEKLLKQASDSMDRYMEHEKNTQVNVSKNRYGTLEINESKNFKKIRNSQEFHGIIESYPDLKANDGIQKLLNEIVKSENSVSEFKQAYNSTVAEYNYTICSFPISMIRGIAKLNEMDYYLEPEKEIEITF